VSASTLRVEGTHLVCPLVSAARTLKLAVIGTAAGLFSGLLGVGGGIVMVPLLVLWLGYDLRTATGTSLSAIVVIAITGTLIQGAYGNVDLLKGALVGVPAVAGVVLGTWVQQRVSTPMIGLLFAGLLTAVAVDLIVA
jgi:uncharacterized membrane protein YfcA